STRCEAILAIDRWLASGAEQATPTQGKPTTRQSALARFTKWPRLAAVLAVPPQPASVLRVAAELVPTSSNPDDHLLTAIAMRRANVGEPAIEQELRRVVPDQRTPLLRHALATSLVAQGRRL